MYNTDILSETYTSISNFKLLEISVDNYLNFKELQFITLMKKENNDCSYNFAKQDYNKLKNCPYKNLFFMFGEHNSGKTNILNVINLIKTNELLSYTDLKNNDTKPVFLEVVFSIDNVEFKILKIINHNGRNDTFIYHKPFNAKGPFYKNKVQILGDGNLCFYKGKNSKKLDLKNKLNNAFQEFKNRTSFINDSSLGVFNELNEFGYFKFNKFKNFIGYKYGQEVGLTSCIKDLINYIEEELINNLKYNNSIRKDDVIYSEGDYGKKIIDSISTSLLYSKVNKKILKYIYIVYYIMLNIKNKGFLIIDDNLLDGLDPKVLISFFNILYKSNILIVTNNPYLLEFNTLSSKEIISSKNIIFIERNNKSDYSEIYKLSDFKEHRNEKYRARISCYLIGMYYTMSYISTGDTSLNVHLTLKLNKQSL